MIKLGLAVTVRRDGALVVMGRPYDDRSEASLNAYEELLLQSPGLVEMEIDDFFKTLRRNVKRMKLKHVRMAVELPDAGEDTVAASQPLGQPVVVPGSPG